jgi:AraC-like DNA-binding protein
MINQGVMIEVLVFGVQAGLSLAIALAILVGRLPLAVRVSGALSALAYGLNLFANSAAADLVSGEGFAWTLTCAFSGTAAGFIWVMVVALFDDRPVTPPLFIPAGTLAAATLVLMESAGATRQAAGLFANAFSTLVVLHALYILGRGWKGDLVESRRRLRRPLVIACVGMAAIQLSHLFLSQWRSEGPGPWVGGSLAIGETTALAMLAAALLELKRSLFEQPAPRVPKSTGADGALIIALDLLMREDEAWREEGLSIGDVAHRLAVPEHRLRRLINGRLGHRNFPAFVNSYRIEAAKRLLADRGPAGGDTVAQIAFDLGFTSLSPFNRAFKDATGETPTAWRRRSTAVG